MEFRDKLYKLGISINNADNGVFLPVKKGVSKAVTHAETFGRIYYSILDNRFKEINTREKALKELANIAKELLEGTFFD